MTPPLIAALYAGLNALILLWLAAEVISRRRKGRVSHGDGGDGAFAKVIRGHGNAAETIPMAIILLSLAELIGAPALALHLAGGAFTLGRACHALHFTGRAPFGFRPLGMLLTLASTAVLALGLIAHSISALV